MLETSWSADAVYICVWKLWQNGVFRGCATGVFQEVLLRCGVPWECSELFCSMGMFHEECSERFCSVAALLAIVVLLKEKLLWPWGGIWSLPEFKAWHKSPNQIKYFVDYSTVYINKYVCKTLIHWHPLLESIDLQSLKRRCCQGLLFFWKKRTFMKDDR